MKLAPPSELPTPMQIAQRDGKTPVVVGEPQIIHGVMGVTTNLYLELERRMRPRTTWTELSREIGSSRQATVAAIRRRDVQYARLAVICKKLDINPAELIVDLFGDCKRNDDLWSVRQEEEASLVSGSE